MPGDIFLSYAREDIDHARKLADALEAHGLATWWDRRLLPGQSFESHIARKLAEAPAVIVVWSSASVGSDWVRDEATEGRSRDRLVPLSLDGTRPPIGFRQLHTPDLTGWNGRPDAPEMAGLVASLRQIMDAPPPAAAGALKAAPAPVTSAPPRSARSGRRALWLSLALILLLGAGAAAHLLAGPQSYLDFEREECRKRNVLAVDCECWATHLDRKLSVRVKDIIMKVHAEGKEGTERELGDAGLTDREFQDQIIRASTEASMNCAL